MELSQILNIGAIMVWSFRKFKMLEQFWCGAFVNFICWSSFGVELPQILWFGAILVWSFHKFYMLEQILMWSFHKFKMLEQLWCGAFVNFILLMEFGVELS